MNKSIFKLAVRSYYAIDDAVLSKLPPAWRKAIFAFAFGLKGRLFGGFTRGDLGTVETERLVPRVPRSGAATKLPGWLTDEVEALRRDVDPELYRGGLPKAATYQRLWPRDPAPVAALKAMQAKSSAPKFVMLAPWIKRGGADLVVLKHLQEFAEAGRTCLITTEPGTSEWLGLVPDGVDVIEAGDLLAGIKHPMDRRLVLARFLMQSGAETIHLVNSRLGWETFRDYGRAISQGAALFASLYCDDVVRQDGSYTGYAHEFLPGCARFLSGVISDNRRYLDRLAGLYGLDPARLHVAYVWTDEVKETPPADGFRILWAGRLDRQKRPDVLYNVARARPDLTFDVFGSTLLSHDERTLADLSGLPNVTMKGAYEGFGSIDTSVYAAMLYTSAWDGLPNVLLEAGMRGMCVVATAVDGIPELIDGTTGWAVRAGADWREHSASLGEAVKDRKAAAERASALRARVSGRHSRHAFRASLEAVPGYFGKTSNP